MNNKYRLHNFNRESNIDTLALTYMHSILNTFEYIPWTGSSIRPSAICTVINDIIINRRKSVIEFGSGISTLFIARLIQKNNLKISFVSVEEDKEWFDFMSGQLETYGLNEFVNFVYAPIDKSLESPWHDISFVKDLESVDCILVDGPKAFSESTKTIRRSAVYQLKEKLADSYSIFLDDCHRQSEKEICNEWAKYLGIKENYYYQHLGVIVKGKYFNVTI